MLVSNARTAVIIWSSSTVSAVGHRSSLAMHRRGGQKKDPGVGQAARKDASDGDKFAELLVFGYSCKLFDDGEKALYHEQGQHLIPWMGDKSIMIDRSVD